MPTTSRKNSPAKQAAAKKAKKPAKKAAEKRPSLTRTVNMGPERGDNSFPPSNKKMPNLTSRSPGTPAGDSTSGPGGKAGEGGNKGEKGGGDKRGGN